jgi:aryl-alcohol dehydrogenase-like predicted oxidoreductase
MRLALGTVQFGLPYGIANRVGQVSRTAAKEILARARISGIDTLDTAVAYGESEACLGEIGTEGFKVITKLPPLTEEVGDVGKWVDNHIERSLSRLRLSRLYAVLVHRSEQITGSRGRAFVEALRELKFDRLVEKIGVSIYSPNELEAARRVCAFDLVQAPFNLIDRRLLTSGWLQKLEDAGVEVHVRSVFLQGLLLMKRSDIPPKFEPWAKCWDAWHAWLDSHAISPVAACIGYAQQFLQVDKLVVGVDSVQQLCESIQVTRLQNDVRYPDLTVSDEMLIHPVNWDRL